MSIPLAGNPTVDLGYLPTPLEPMYRITRHFGGPTVWIKRDDCTGLATGGNKTRKLEFLMADAIAKDANTIITFGAIQSNHARQTAAACAKLGLECHLVLSRRVAWTHPEFETNGNVLLDRLMGAHIQMCDPANADQMGRTMVDLLTGQGKRCYVIPAGGSNAIGALGYMRCAAEICAQSAQHGFQPDLIVHATSSGGTQAGLVAGFAAQAFKCEVIGINVYDPDHARIEQRVTRLLRETLEHVKVVRNNVPQIKIEHGFLGEDYGIPTPQTIAAMRLLATSEGILTDPVYSGKAFAGLTDLMLRKEMNARSHVIFLHTGGVASLPTYSEAFAG